MRVRARREESEGEGDSDGTSEARREDCGSISPYKYEPNTNVGTNLGVQIVDHHLFGGEKNLLARQLNLAQKVALRQGTVAVPDSDDHLAARAVGVHRDEALLVLPHRVEVVVDHLGWLVSRVWG